MAYKVNVESIAEDVPDIIQKHILKRLESYDFPYVSTVPNKNGLRTVFQEYFEKRRGFSWLKSAVTLLVTSKRGIVPIAMTETNRLHTGGLADFLLSKNVEKCKTIHSYGNVSIAGSCIKHIHEKELDVETVLKNSFPQNSAGLNADIPMIPQHPNCRHVMAPIDDSVLN